MRVKKNPPITNAPTDEKASDESEHPDVNMSSIDEMIGQMTLKEKIGQLMIIGVEGKTFSTEMDNLIRTHHVGGIILMGKNVSTANEMQKLINEVKNANKQNKIPFISIDEEADGFRDCLRKLTSFRQAMRLENGMTPNLIMRLGVT